MPLALSSLTDDDPPATPGDDPPADPQSPDDTPESTPADPDSAAAQPPIATEGPASIDEPAAGHIFNDNPGHLPDTPANRALLTNLVNDPANLLGTDQWGSDRYAQTQGDGTQIWARVQSTGIRSGGMNPTPGTWNPITGLTRP